MLSANYSALKKITISGAGKIFLSFEILLGYVDADPGGLINPPDLGLKNKLQFSKNYLSP
jgi:hypothetical protein